MVLGLAVVAAACTAGGDPVLSRPSASTTAAGRTAPTATAPTTIEVTTTSLTTTTTSVTTTTTTLPTVPLRPGPDPAPPEAGMPLAAGTTGVAVVAAGGADLRGIPGGAVVVRAYEGLVFPVLGRADGDWLRVLSGCEDELWAHGSEVQFSPTHPPGSGGPIGPGFDLGDAVIVLDPGHGGPNTGAIGPATGVAEKVVDLDIARRARDLMSAPRTVDPDTGRVLPGDQIPAFGTVWVTRTEGPPGADVEAGLAFRAQLANMAGAHAFVSIHNNADPDGPAELPGSETFYRFADPGSRRLAGLLMEELLRSFTAFEGQWVADSDAGAKYRVREDGVTDYYGVLRRAQVPAVLAEGAYISNPSEDLLLATPEFRHAYAEAIYRALVHFLTTDDPGSLFTEPYPRTKPAGSGAPQPECAVPAQPGT